MIEEWKLALKKLKEGHCRERNSMSKDMAHSYVTRRKMGIEGIMEADTKKGRELIQDCKGLQMSSYRL